MPFVSGSPKASSCCGAYVARQVNLVHKPPEFDKPADYQLGLSAEYSGQQQEGKRRRQQDDKQLVIEERECGNCEDEEEATSGDMKGL